MDRELAEFLKALRPESHVIDMGVNKETGEREWLHAAQPGKGVCDFCSSTPVVCVFEAGTIRLMIPGSEGPDLGSSDPWAACADCKPLVEAKNRDALVDRAAKLLGAKFGMPKALARQSVKMVQDAFWKARENRSGS